MREPSRLLRRCVIVALLVAASSIGRGQPAAWGASCEVGVVRNAPDALAQLDEMRIEHCLGGAACDDELCRRISAWESRPPGANAVDEAAVLMRAIRAEADRLDPALPGVRPLQLALADWERRTRGATGRDLPAAAWQLNKLVLFAGEPNAISAPEILSAVCERSPDSCTVATRAMARVLTLGGLQHRVLDRLLDPLRTATAERLARTDRRWQSYLANGPASMPWELALSRGKATRLGSATCFPEPPLSQLVLLHPAASYQFVKARSSQLDEAVVLEVIGIASWKFGDDDAIRPGFGGSLMLAWDGQSKGHAAPGVMLHLTPAISVGVGWRRETGEDTWPVYATGDLARLLTSRDRLRQAVLGWAMTAAP